MINLSDISDIPSDFASVKVVPIPVPSDISMVDISSISSIDTSSLDSSHDTMSVSSSDDMQSLTAKLRQGSWPEIFQVPKLGPELNLIFETGNAKYSSTKEQPVLGKDVKSQFLDAIANDMWQYKAYPTHLEYLEVAKAILEKYPCLTEKGSASGFDGLVNSLKFKMGNMRAKMRKLECLEMKINSRKRSGPGMPSKSKVKKPRRAELNFLPELPRGEDETSMEIHRKFLVAEMQKKNKNFAAIRSRISLTFAYRRRELVVDAPHVKTTMERWPGIFLESELSAEFSRLANASLEARFFSSLDQHLEKFMHLLRHRQGSCRKKIQEELQSVEGIDEKRTAVLRCLPLYFKENLFYVDCEDVTESGTYGTQKIVIEEPHRIYIYVEGSKVIEDLGSFPKAVALYFSIHYCLHLEYVAGQLRTMEFIQKVLFNLDGKKLSPKVQTLKNLLMADSAV